MNLIPDKQTIGYASAVYVNATGLYQEAKIDNNFSKQCTGRIGNYGSGQ